MVSIYYIKKILLLTYLLTKYGIDIDVAIVSIVLETICILHFADIQYSDM